MIDRFEARAARGQVQDVRGRAVPAAPSYESLPSARARSTRGGPAVREMSVRVEVITPILGGGTQIRAIDAVDVIRAATARGHLRFWWRAIYSVQCQGAEDLYARESALWGRAATDEGGRSAIEVRIDVEQASPIDESDIRLYDSRDGKATPGAYALWPARAETRTRTPPAPRREQGTRFLLTLLVPANREGEIRNAVRAWLLFGGYGSRTRRGLGSFRVLDDPSSWLPSMATREAIKTLFGLDVFASPGKTVTDSPWLGGAALQVGKVERDAMKAWMTALEWLKEFRQGTSGQSGESAREPGTRKLQPQRPSISNWPEADKVRHLSTAKKGLRWAHQPRHNGSPAWPRAGFGLPIIGQFQQQSRQKNQAGKNLYWDQLATTDPSYGTEPGSFELCWRSGNSEHDRLASPLIVKELPLADGTFVPCAMWLNRAYPDGNVVLRGVNNSAAPFDRLVAAGDTPRFSALANKLSLRQAFLDWLHAKYRTTVVAP
ncbi:MAG: type III-B CRISPR module RAMP protein Cmr1 [Candidatus Schekmanbacteria bacterium]|nr:type III-B CRISPR module RAMP protein Cmr1 [Candidatus Schekmanbacteria bacterium]